MKFEFTKREFDHFVEYAGFTDEELQILTLKRRGWRNIDIAEEIDRSERTVVQRSKSINKKILKVIKEESSE